jgi:O-antigen ligase
MELIIPEYSLAIWTFVSLAYLVLAFIALFRILRNDDWGRKESLLWIVIVFFIPVLGSILYFRKAKNKSGNINQYN